MSQLITNPATLAPLGEVPESGTEAIEQAVAAARAAAGPWRNTPDARRAALLKDIAGRIGALAGELADLCTRESGMARCESLDCVHAAAAGFDVLSRNPPIGDAAGVTALLLPFDLPLPVMGAGVARALAAGQTVVCKPPAQNPLTSLALARAFDGLPDGTVSVVTGGRAVGRALSAHPDVAAILFTGSSSAGLEVATAARGKRLDLEVGTVDAQIVCRDTDLDLTVPAVAWTRLVYGGQGSLSGGHIYVERSLAREFVDRLHQCVGFLDVDDPAKPSTDLGPLISLDAARKLEDQVGRTLRAGAKLILGGRRFRPSGLPGHFFQPTILTDVPAGSVPMREQLLGPVITVTPVADLAEALRLCTEFSPRPLISPSVASIYTADAEAAGRAVQAMAEGFFRINDPPVGALGPFSGLRHLGIRHALGVPQALGVPREDPPRKKHVEMARAIERKAWWFPYVDRARLP
jgi:acyl-CoA reductase-like NAD-dependent aldehyde dehydrogenase